MKTLKTAAVVLFCLSIITANAATIAIDGNVFLENQQNHDSIEILFERSAPSSYSAKAYTNAEGYFNLQIETGIYNITYSKPGFRPEFVTDIALYSNSTLTKLTLKQSSTRIIVPIDISTIQGAIDAANIGDTIIVEQGTYKENINFNGKDVVLASRFLFSGDQAVISSTVIDGNQNGHVVEFTNGETSKAQLIGLRIINGKTKEIGFQPYSVCGGGICCFNSSPTLNNLIVSNNSTTSDAHYDCFGAGIYLGNSNAGLSNLMIDHNNTNYSGGGIGIDESSNPVITNCTIEFNKASFGAGIHCEFGSNAKIVNLIIKNNTASSVGGGIACFADSVLIENSLITNNNAESYAGGILFSAGDITVRNASIIDNYSSTRGSGISLLGLKKILISNCIFKNNNGSADIYNNVSGDGKNLTIEYTDFFNNNPNYFYNIENKYLGSIITTNTNGVPCDAYYNVFVDPLTNSDHTLQSNSPCIDAGTNDGITSPVDLAGNQRIWDGNGDSLSFADMGAYEYGSQLLPPKTEYSITGNVYAGTGKLSGGIALLFYKTDTFSLPVEFSPVNNGVYAFSLSDSGNFLIYVMPDNANAEQYLPTYYVSESSWQNAHLLKVDGKLYGVDIQMLPLSTSTIGTGMISGYISYTDSSVYEAYIYNNINNPGIPKNSPSDKIILNPAQNIGFSLCNETGDVLDWTLSNPEGYFEFSDLSLGKYKVMAQKSGYTLKNQPLIELTQENDSISNVMFQIEKEYITVNINDNEITTVPTIKIYPNPVMSDLEIELNPGKSGTVNIIFYDSQGRLVYNSDIAVIPSTLQKLSISLDNMLSGLYYGRVISDKINRVFKFVKTTNLNSVIN